MGDGLAGACAADALASAGLHVTLVSDGRPGASTLAALVNPFTGPRASPAWRYAEALAAVDALLARAGRTLRAGLFRPARDEKQATAFRARAEAHPDALAWRDYAPSPDVRAPFGGLDVRVGGVWHTPLGDLGRLLDRHAEAGRLERVRATVVGMDVRADGVRLRTSGPACEAEVAILATGAGLAALAPSLAPHLHAVKGEVFEATHPQAALLVPVAAGGYAVPVAADRVALGGTYDHAWTDLVPDLARGEALRQKLLAFLPGLGGLVPGTARAGLRVQRPHVRRPLLEPLDPAGRVWALGGLGAKGLLHAPYVASLLPAALRDPSSVPVELRAGPLTGAGP